jgi:hypothetical protein
MQLIGIHCAAMSDYQPCDSPDTPPVKKRREHRRTIPAPPVRQDLDRRSLAAKMYDAQAAAIKVDLGGAEGLSTKLQLVDNFCVLSVAINAMSVDLLLGKPVDILELATLSSASLRVASRLGLRRARTVETPELRQYLDERQADAIEGSP